MGFLLAVRSVSDSMDIPDDSISDRRRWLALVPALTVPFLASLFYFVVFSDSILGKVGYGFAKGFIVFWPLIGVLVIFRQRLSSLREYRSIRFHVKTIPLGILLGLFIVGAMLVMMWSPLGEQVMEGGERVRVKAVGLGFADQFVPFAVFICVVHSLLEEYYWRWFVYGNLRHVLAQPWAHGVAAVGFAAHHLVITLQFFEVGLAIFLTCGVATGGLIWSYLYERQGSLMAPWVSHMIVDIGLMVLAHRLIFG